MLQNSFAKLKSPVCLCLQMASSEMVPFKQQGLEEQGLEEEGGVDGAAWKAMPFNQQGLEEEDGVDEAAWKAINEPFELADIHEVQGFEENAETVKDSDDKVDAGSENTQSIDVCSSPKKKLYRSGHLTYPDYDARIKMINEAAQKCMEKYNKMPTRVVKTLLFHDKELVEMTSRELQLWINVATINPSVVDSAFPGFVNGL
jgi:hypothetical protein